jgi:hypothetical protein
MLSRMPGILGKLAELAGAGLASAAGAYVFAQLATPAAPPPIVQIEPVQEELVRAMRSENAALIQELRKVEAAKTAASESAPPRVASVATPKPPKSAQVPVAARKPNADHGGMGADPKTPMDARAQSTAAAPLVPISGSNPATPVVDSTSAIDRSAAKEGEFPWIARLKQIPDIFRPAPNDPGVAPRPPLPVGELVSGEM